MCRCGRLRERGPAAGRLRSRQPPGGPRLSMKRRLKHGLAIAGATFCLLVLGPTIAAALPNGGFENGTLSGWRTDSDGAGQWQTYSGPGFQGLAPPAQGTFAAETTQTPTSSNVLYRNLRLKMALHYRLSLRAYYVNEAGVFSTPHSLSRTVIPNQQYRIDLMKPHSPLRSLKPKDVLMNLFRTRVGDPGLLAPTLVSKNISRFAGHTVRLRMVEVDNQANFAAGVDAVELRRR